MPNSTCVIVFGVQRSGTSATAGLLHHLGVHMGNSFTNPAINDNNSKGYFEALEWIWINQRALGGARDFYHMYNLLVNILYPDRRTMAVSYNQEQRIYLNTTASMVSRQYELWGVKDPRFFYPNLLEEFAEIVSSHAEVKIVYCHRDSESVAGSIARVTQRPVKKQLIREAVKMRQELNANLLEKLPYDTINIYFEKYFVDPEKQGRELAKFVGVKYEDQLTTKWIDEKMRRFK